MRRLVILRPEPGASATLERARAAGLEAVAIPLFVVHPLDWIAPDAGEYDALVLTSANAVRHAGPQLTGLVALPAYCVGEASAATAREAGLEIAEIGPGDAQDLAAGIPPGLRLLHLAGRDHRPLPGTVTIPVYASEAIDPPPALDALRGAVAMVHSPRAGARLAELVGQRGETMLAAISPAAAGACGNGWEKVAAAGHPDELHLLALTAELCQNHRR